MAEAAAGAEMLEIGDDGQLAEGGSSARGDKPHNVSSSVCSTPDTQESNKNAGAAFQYPATGASAENSGEKATQVS